ncbi:zinc metalloprotease [Chryseobacterium sp.]|uniref:zinc metalloprotease n=1 Tax=Chryseobacterium sp. TaxID=1871047 RepID=UPI0025C6D597|nr:zinc metalloprotease [Chryseobacterium sp.]
MKKLLFTILFLGLVSSCNNDTISNQTEESPNTLTTSTSANMANKRTCISDEIRKQDLQSNPELVQKMNALEANTDNFIKKLQAGKVLADGTIEIPVVVNVIYRTSAENISDARIAEQIAVLNADFGGINSDANKVPTEFQSVKANDTKIKFRLANIVRKSSTKTSWTGHTMKQSSQGGIDATTPSNYLNIWLVGTIASTRGITLGFATFPESAGAWNDGVVIATQFFGKTGATAPFNLGRTATHEVGHYLNLRHIWGDAYCGNDLVDDTPTQQADNSGQPSYPLYQVCGGVSRSVMFMNYMDYVNDAAMFMFSAGQRVRMQSVVASSGARAGLRVL